MEMNTVTVESLTAAIQALQAQLAVANKKIESHQNELGMAAQHVQSVERELAQAKYVTPRSELTAMKPRINKPTPFTGKGSVKSWTVQMDNYVRDIDQSTAFNIALSYLSGNAHEWWIFYQNSKEGKGIEGWQGLREALIRRFDTLNREKIARDKLATSKEVKDVATFNDYFLRILLESPNINVEEQIDRYTRSLNTYLWRGICTKKYTVLSNAMRDAERVESAHRWSGTMNRGQNHSLSNGSSAKQSSVRTPMAIGNFQTKNMELGKLTKEEREKCMREGLCLRCREKRHMARNCPKARRNCLRCFCQFQTQ